MRIFIFILLFSLASCGGGGGGGGGGPTTTNGSGGNNNPNWISSISSAEANIYRTSEYNFQWCLEAIHAAEAYALLAKNNKAIAGSGVNIAIVDTGVGTARVEILANYVPSGYDYVNNDLNPDDDNGHGTNVASIAAGVKNNYITHGVAYQSGIVGNKVLNAGGSGTYLSIADSIYDIASDLNVKIINMSLGGGYDGGLVLDAISATKSADMLTVISSGNSANIDPSYPALYAADPDVAGYILAVAAVDNTSTIASFSNFCGLAKDYCLSAPGVDINGAYNLDDIHYTTYSGTSQAAPHVAGAAAVIRAAWTFLTAPQVAQILLTTATDLGPAGIDDVYGHGMLNLYAAAQAQGQNTLGYGTSISDGGYDLRASSMISSPIFGDAFASNIVPQLSSAIFFDDYGRDYKANLGNKISMQSPINPLAGTNFLLNNIAYKTVPLQLSYDGKTQMKFNLSSYKNSAAQNDLGLRFAVLDKSVDPQLYNSNNGFSFIQKDIILPNSKFGFAFNYDEISTNQLKEFGNLGFILKNNFATNPYQSFLQDNYFNFQNSRKFNQFFLDQNFSDQRFALKFSYQSSYDNQKILGKGGNKQNQILDFGLDFKTKNNGSFLISAGNLIEFSNNILNARSLGAFESQGNVKTSYLKFSASQELFKDLQLIASFSEGVSKINGNQNGIFREFNNVKSRSTSIALIHNNFAKGKLGITYLEPLRVYSGNVQFNIPIARDAAGNLMRYSGTASLVPQGKERDLEMFYSRDFDNFSNLRFNLVMQKDAGNIKGAAINYVGFVNYRQGF